MSDTERSTPAFAVKSGWLNDDLQLAARRVEMMRDGYRPKPIAYTKEEGGCWLMWRNWPIKQSPLAHAIKFEDGSIFDMVNGWRPSKEEMEAKYPMVYLCTYCNEQSRNGICDIKHTPTCPNK